MKFIVEVHPARDDTPADLEGMIEEAIREQGYSARAKLVEEEDE